MNRKLEGRAKVIAIPSGRAPLWVRRQWVGTTLPIEAEYHRRGYAVPAKEAVSILARKSNKAAAYWAKRIIDQDVLVFPKRSVRIIGKLKDLTPIRHRPGILELGVGAHDACVEWNGLD